MAAAGAVRPVRFGAFAFDPSSRELRKGGTWLRVPGQSLAILAMLLDRPGELITREEIQARLWPHGTVVEFEHSVNSAGETPARGAAGHRRHAAVHRDAAAPGVPVHRQGGDGFPD